MINYYVNDYHGTTIPTELFDRCAKIAHLKIKKYTFNRINEDNKPDNYNDCLCEVAEIIYKDGISDNNIQSESTDGYSVTYIRDSERLENKIYKTIELYLSDFMYLGCDYND